jgi:hypothetical protein
MNTGKSIELLQLAGDYGLLQKAGHLNCVLPARAIALAGAST